MLFVQIRTVIPHPKSKVKVDDTKTSSLISYHCTSNNINYFIFRLFFSKAISTFTSYFNLGTSDIDICDTCNITK